MLYDVCHMRNLHAEVRMIFFTEMSYSLTHTEFCCEKCLRLIKVFYKFSLLFYFILFSWWLISNLNSHMLHNKYGSKMGHYWCNYPKKHMQIWSSSAKYWNMLFSQLAWLCAKWPRPWKLANNPGNLITCLCACILWSTDHTVFDHLTCLQLF